MIPKKIYYIWFGKNPLPKIVKKNLDNWKNKNPDFQIIKIDESNYDVNKYEYTKKAYNDKKWAFVSDVARLDVIYHNGGFYFDTDVFFLKSINSLCKYNSVWGMENSGLIASGLIIGAQKGDSDLKNLLDIYKNKEYDSNKLAELSTVGIISNYFKKQGLRISNHTQVLENNKIIFAPQYFAPYHWWGGGKISSKTIAIQQYLNSWGADTSVSSYHKFIYNLRYKAPYMYIFLKKLYSIFKNK